MWGVAFTARFFFVSPNPPAFCWWSFPPAVCWWSFPHIYWSQQAIWKRKKTTQAVKTLPTLIKEKEPLWYRKPSTVKLLHRKRKGKINGDQERGLLAWPETGSWRELITLLERARLVWTSLAAKFTECTWSSGAIFLTWGSRFTSLKGFRVWVLDGSNHTQKEDVESNGGSLENVAEIFVLFFCGV